MNKPPKEIDNALTLEWAWSGNKPFGYLRYDNGEVACEIFGLAICQYQSTGEIYRFSCDRNWETQQDFPYDSIDAAKALLPEQHKLVSPKWQVYD